MAKRKKTKAPRSRSSRKGGKKATATSGNRVRPEPLQLAPNRGMRKTLQEQRGARKARPVRTTHKVRSRWFQSRATWPRREARAGFLAEERARVKASLADHVVASGWSQAGPTNIGGRTTSIVVHPTQPARLLVGAAGGGVWRSADSGITWERVWDDSAPTLNIGSLALDPNNPQTVYCGTGEANLSADSYPGVGLYRSTDFGTIWSLVASSLDDVVPSRIGVIAVDPFDAQHLRIGGIGFDSELPGGTGGMFVSTDGGATWARETFISQNNHWCHSIVFDSERQGRIYATFTEQGFKNGIWRSVNGGRTWSHRRFGLPFAPAMHRTTLAIAASDTRVLYALVSDSSGGMLGVFRTTNGGFSWTSVGGAHFDDERQMFYNSAIVVKPDDPNVVLCGGVDLHRTQDAGATWFQVSEWDAQRGGPRYAHADQHALAISPSAPEFVYAVNDGGLDVSDDVGSSWENHSDGLATNMFYDLAVAPANGEVYGGGAQDNGTIITAEAKPDDFFEVSGGDGGWIVWDPNNVNHFYTSAQGTFIIRFRPGSPAALVSPPAPQSELDSMWMVYIAMDPNDSNRVFTGTQRVWRTLDDAESWQAVSEVLDGSDITAIEISRADGNRIYVGTENGGFFRSIDGGDSWTPNLAGSTLPGRTITRIAAQPTDENTLFATVANFGHSHVFRSNDGGDSWLDVDQGRLPDAPHHSVTFRRNRPNTVIVCGDAGVFISTDLGASWENLSADLPSVSCVDLVYHEVDRTLSVATYGRSLWRIGL